MIGATAAFAVGIDRPTLAVLELHNMLLVRTFAGPSAIEGVGVFAADPIAKGTLVWRYDPAFDRLVPASWLETADEIMREFLIRYAYPAPDDPSQLVIEIDNGRLMNHSKSPNTDFTAIRSGIAIRDIAAGEEIVCDYDEFDPAHELLPSLAAVHSVMSQARANGLGNHTGF